MERHETEKRINTEKKQDTEVQLIFIIYAGILPRIIFKRTHWKATSNYASVLFLVLIREYSWYPRCSVNSRIWYFPKAQLHTLPRNLTYMVHTSFACSRASIITHMHCIRRNMVAKPVVEHHGNEAVLNAALLSVRMARVA